MQNSWQRPSKDQKAEEMHVTSGDGGHQISVDLKENQTTKSFRSTAHKERFMVETYATRDTTAIQTVGPNTCKNFDHLAKLMMIRT